MSEREVRASPVPRWVDGVGALGLAILAFNVHVSTQGDALSSLDRGERRVAYGVMLVADAVLFTACFLGTRRGSRQLAGALGFGIFTSVTALLLDVRDGPVRTVQLLWLFGLFVALAGVARMVVLVNRERGSL